MSDPTDKARPEPDSTTGSDGVGEGEEAKADRPGGPGQSAMNPVEPGQATPAPDDEEPDEDEVVKARRAHLEQG